MSKNKFIKKLLVAGLCALTATAMIGATACKDKGDDDGETGHVHNYATGSDWSKDAEGHWYACKNTGHTDAYTKTAHTDTNNDNKCDVCGYVLTTGGNQGGNEGGNQGGNEGGNQGGNEGGNEGGGENVTYATQKVAINISELDAGDLADGTELVAGSGISAAGKLTINGNEKYLYYNSDTSTKVTKRLQLKGKGTFADGNYTNTIKFEIANDNSVIVVHAYSGTDGEDRSLLLKDSEFNDVDTQSIGVGKNYMGTAVFEVNKGTYFVTSGGSTVNVYHIAVWEGGKLKETVIEEKAAKAAACAEDGNIAYTLTNFGRYKNDKGEVISGTTTSLAKLGHDYEVVAGTLNPATATDVGSVTLHCSTLDHVDLVAELPVLTSSKYVVDTQGQEAGKALYGYAVPNTEDSEGKKASVSFVADKVERPTYSFDNVIYQNLFGTAISSVGYGVDNANTLANGLKMYGIINKTEATAYSSGITQEVTSTGRLEVKDSNTSDTAYTYIVFDQAKTSGAYKISGTLHMPTQNGSWSIFQLIGSNVQSTSDAAFAAIRSDGNKKLGITTQNSNDDVSLTTAAAYTKETDITFEIVLNLEEKTVTLKIGSEVVVSDANAIDITNSLGANGWQGIRLQTAGSGTRNVYLSNLTIAEGTLPN